MCDKLPTIHAGSRFRGFAPATNGGPREAIYEVRSLVIQRDEMTVTLRRVRQPGENLQTANRQTAETP